MLVRMQPSAAPAPSPASSTFAGVLMDLAVPEAKRPPVRDLDGLEDDVATLSYEHAIRLHGRYRSPALDPKPQLVPDSQAESPAATPESPASLLDRRSASVTVRLCPAESERLRQRAAESGLTVSDYLRSCVFEVESLRTQVKETVAALRALQVQKSQTSHPWWKRWLRSRGVSDKVA